MKATLDVVEMVVTSFVKEKSEQKLDKNGAVHDGFKFAATGRPRVGLSRTLNAGAKAKLELSDCFAQPTLFWPPSL